jgi:hypothetical protein
MIVENRDVVGVSYTTGEVIDRHNVRSMRRNRATMGGLGAEKEVEQR